MTALATYMLLQLMERSGSRSISKLVYALDAGLAAMLSHRSSRPRVLPRTEAEMIVVRVMRGVTDHFSRRVADWFLSAMLTNFGTILLGKDKMFERFTAFKHLENIFREETWGWVCVILGATRLLSLAINGTFPAFRWSPHVRFVAAMLSCFVWFQVYISLEVAAEPTTGLAIYRYLFLFDIYNAFLAASEAGRAERMLQNGGARR
jgi:hypothetical protein